MSNQMPQLGAKISLISKADIRYEGRLFQVDPQDCTIALANVRSFGTEDRETMYPVPAQTQVYEYILFRGSDIKDIRVVPPQPHIDPAIVQSVPISQQPAPAEGSAFQMPGSSGLGTSVLGQNMHALGGFGSYGAGGLGGITRAPGPLLMQQQPSELGLVGQPAVPVERKEDLMSGGSRSTTPLLTRKSPTMDQGTQVTKSPPREDVTAHPKPIQPPDRDNRGGRRTDQHFYQPRDQAPGNYRRDGNNDYQRDRRQPFHENNRNDYQRDRNDYQRNDRNDYQRDRNDFQRNDFYNRRPNNNFRNYRDGPDDNQYPNRGYQNRQGSDGWVPRNQNNGNMNNSVRGGAGPGGPGGAGGRGRGRGGQGRPTNNSSGTPQANKKNPLKFDVEYDFDKANNEFEEMRAQLNKIKITAEEQVAAQESGKEIESNEGTHTEANTGDSQADNEVFYDMKKSFFDCISCEAVERSKGRSQRTDWRTERKLNTETFGVSSARRGMYRGRGYYHGNRNYGYRPRNNVNGETQGQGSQAPAPAATEPLIQKTLEKLEKAMVAPKAPLLAVS